MTIIKLKKRKKPQKKLPFRGKVPANVDPAVGLHEERRDQIRNFLKDHKKRQEAKAKPNYDNMPAIELTKAKWSGIRHNAIADTIEIWVLGIIKGEMPANGGNIDYERLATLHAEVFLTVGSIAAVPEE